MDIVVYGVIVGVSRLKNSQFGNPRYRLYVDNGSAPLTENDSHVNYTIDELIGKRVELHFRNGRVLKVNFVETTEQPPRAR